MLTQPKPFLTPEQYLEIEEKAERKSEYYNGEMFLMAGVGSDHVQICQNFSLLFGLEFRERPCYIHTSDTRVQVSPTGLYTYPDVILACGDRQWADKKRVTLLNPLVIIEILSDSTEAYDRGEKFWHYRQLESLQEYILVSQKAFRIDQFIRQPNGEWLLRSNDSLDDILEVPSVGCSMPVREIYRKTVLMG